jgi:hypothetical protein
MLKDLNLPNELNDPNELQQNIAFIGSPLNLLPVIFPPMETKDDKPKRKFDEIKWLNLDDKPENEIAKRGDIVLLSEIIANTMYWQAICTGPPSNSGLIFKHITNLDTVRIL